MACGGFYCSKNALAALNILYIFVAIMLMSIAGYGYMVAMITSIGVLGGIIACGVFLFFVALMGLLGALKHHQVLLFFYMIILFLIFLLQFSLACVCLAMNEEQVGRVVTDSWRVSSDDMKAVVQSKLDCCGLEQKDDESYPSCAKLSKCMKFSGNGTDVPECCLDMSHNATSHDPSFLVACPQQQCLNVILSNVNRILKTAGGVGLVFSFSEIFGVWMAWRYRNQKDPRANPNAFL